ncbi:hypothetical protein EST38_g11185 [Candolleomyces aberdarensis]|uniref:Uncharacterized protein n=1 Tax=Candolleomyces aberdarensis TaxID=2316362 RepID=A0A4V1Q2D1_9AGAR|nr:hypothetical protein EST38_g11185 [Candolleomyces aberdarensis]
MLQEREQFEKIALNRLATVQSEIKAKQKKIENLKKDIEKAKTKQKGKSRAKPSKWERLIGIKTRIEQLENQFSRIERSVYDTEEDTDFIEVAEDD